MLTNLVSNAVKFTASGFVRVEARTVVGEDGAALLEFSVRDSGIGIAPEKHALLFQPFSQADTSTTRLYGGSGLGLSIVRRLAEVGEEDRVDQLGFAAREFGDKCDVQLVVSQLVGQRLDAQTRLGVFEVLLDWLAPRR